MIKQYFPPIAKMLFFIMVILQTSCAENVAVFREEPPGIKYIHGVSNLRFTENCPEMDGATALYPLYLSAFNNVCNMGSAYYLGSHLHNSRTPEAWNNIISGNVDIIFVAQPSEQQKKYIQDKNIKLKYTPFAREAFVFIVNANNPVQSLTTNQIRDIFSGKVTRWSSVGGDYKSIQAWQRPEGSGSQTIMLAKVMQGVPLLPRKEKQIKVATLMGTMIENIAEYQNTRGAIGYTYRYYATQMNTNKDIKLLAINGIEPTEENIRNGTYPFIVEAFMVTRENPTTETQQFVDWVLSPQGQQLVQDVGYVPLYPIMNSFKKNVEK